MFLDYRFFATDDVHFVLPGNTQVQIDNKNHTIIVGLRCAFWRPPACVASGGRTGAGAATADSTGIDKFTVFFEFDRADLTPDGLTVIGTAAEATQSGRFVRLGITGYADRVGREPYNLDLSRERAETVATELVMNGARPR